MWSNLLYFLWLTLLRILFLFVFCFVFLASIHLCFLFCYNHLIGTFNWQRTCTTVTEVYTGYTLHFVCLPSAPASSRRLLAAAASLSGQQQAEVLATDSEQDRSAVEGPAALSFSLPTNKPGSHFSVLPSVHGTEGNGNRSGETTLPQQQQGSGVTAPSSPTDGRTVADSRPALSAGQPVGQHTVQGERSTPSAGMALHGWWRPVPQRRSQDLL